MAKKPTIRSAPRIKIPTDRQTPAQTFAPRATPPITRLPPTPKKPKEAKK
jgi:hypothetical protein